MNKQNIFLLLGVVIIIAAIVLAVKKPKDDMPVTQEPALISSATYACNEGKTISASYYSGESKPAVGNQPPVPGGSVKLTLSDGRSMTLAQTISADGARYSDGNPSVNGDEHFVFWSKGNGALVLEDNQEKSYIGCVTVAADTTGQLSQVYQNGEMGVTLRYPKGFVVNESYVDDSFGPSKSVHGVSFTIDPAIAEGTNLSKDTKFIIETIPGAATCTGTLFSSIASEDAAHAKTHTETINGIEYSVYAGSDAAAGNRYEDTIYAIPGTNPCMAVRYFVHYGNIGNYPAGTVKEFDSAALLKIFNGMRDSVMRG